MNNAYANDTTYLSSGYVTSWNTIFYIYVIIL